MEPDLIGQEKAWDKISADGTITVPAMEPDLIGQEKPSTWRQYTDTITVPQWSLTSSVRKSGVVCGIRGAVGVPAMEPDLIGQEKNSPPACPPPG